MCLTFDQKAKMIKLKEEGMMKAEKGQKLALILLLWRVFSQWW